MAWARATGALVVEDDYDSEFRYDVAPLPALYGLDPDVVAYLGTTAKTLTPALGVGWLVARPDLIPGSRRGHRPRRRRPNRPSRPPSCSPATWTGTSGGCGASTRGAATR